MKQVFLLVGIVLVALCATAQKQTMKWGKIDDKDLEMKVYEHDSAAEAVILGDYGEIYFTSNTAGVQLNIKRYVRIKVLKSEGSKWANVEIPVYKSGSEEEKISSLKGMVYNMVGGKLESTKMQKDARYKEKSSDWLDYIKFTMPNVKEGSIIEYEYHKMSPFFYELETWVFQTGIPSRWSELNLMVPEALHYKTMMQGYHTPAIYDSKRFSGSYGTTGIEFYWAMTNLPALKNEAYITTLQDYASKIEFELSTINVPGELVKHFSSDWEKLRKSFMDDSRFGGELKKQRQVSKLVEELTKGMVKPEEKLNTLYKHIQQNVKYNGTAGALASQNFKETLEKRAGNAADVNLLLIAMLREAGFTANPVILSTRSHGRVNPVVPLEKDFNYVLCQLVLENERLLIDATDPLLPLGTLPFRCMNGEGRLISETTDWVSLLNKEKNYNTITAKLKLSGEGVLTGTLSHLRDGYSAHEVRQQLVADGEDKYLEKKKELKTNWSIQELKFTNQNELSSRLEEHLEVEIREKATVAGGRIYLSLLPEGVEESNPFKLDDRKFPVDFGCPTDKMLMYEIELPEGYEVEALPQPSVIYMPDKSALFRHNVTQMGNKLVVTSAYQIKKPMYLPEEYQHLKQFYQLMLAKQNEQVVLKTKN